MSKPSRKKSKQVKSTSEKINKLLEIGLQFHRSRQVRLAEDAYRKVIELEPLNFRGLYLLGILNSEVGQNASAVEFLKLAIQVNPTYSLAHNDLGVVYQTMGMVKEASEAYKRALELNKNFHEAQNNLGVAMQSRGQPNKAKEHFKKALEMNPYYFDAFNNYIFSLDMSEDQTVQSLIDIRKKWSETHEEPLLLKHKSHTNLLTTDRKLRIGYVSADFRLHSASFCFGTMLKNFDRSKFEVYAYNNSYTPGDLRTNEFKENVTVWKDIYGVSEDDLAAMIRKDQIDILVDLSGYSAGSRLLTFARKPAPIQACGWGYATSTGLKSMDYFLADNMIVPEEERSLYVENVAYMPCVVNYFAIDSVKPDVGPLPAERTGIITFGSFNRVSKISDETFAVWAKVLQAVPNSRFLFKINEEQPNATKDRIVEIMVANGVNPKRLWFAGKTSLADHLKTFNDVDISLDPWPHTGGLTSVDSCLMGVPVITYKWPTIVGRLTSSILNQVGLNDWVASNPEEYVKLAVAKSSDLVGLAKIRSELRDRFNRAMVGDSVAYCREVEKLYLGMWERYVKESE